MQNIIAEIVSDFSTLTGIPCDLRPDGTVVLLAADVPRLLAVGRMASAGHTPSPTPTPSTSGRAGVDWAAAGRKSWETRRRNAKSQA
mgnify:FL=1